MESKQTNLFIFLDGPKINATTDELNAINELRVFVKLITGFESIQIIEQTSNIGLSKSIVYGINKVLESHKEVIVLEDDIIVGQDFLSFMNLALKKYENNPKVAGISGYSFPINEQQPFFSRTGSCWGWATYKRVWDDFLIKRNELNLSLISNNEMSLFNVYNNVYSNMFLQNKQGVIQSWAVEFYLYYFSKKYFFLMPGLNLVANEGFDGSGAHKKRGNFLTDNNPIRNLSKINFPHHVVEEKQIRKKIQKLYEQGFSEPSFIISFVNKIKSVLLGNENNNH